MEHENLSPLQWGSMIDGVRRFLASINDLVPAGQLSTQQVTQLIDALPNLTEPRLIELGEKDSSCPICMTPYLAILAEEETAHAMDSPAHPVEELGVTKLDRPWQCGHIFCRRDISKWIIEGHDSCPMCRKRLVEPEPEPEQADPGPTTTDTQSNTDTQSPPPPPPHQPSTTSSSTSTTTTTNNTTTTNPTNTNTNTNPNPIDLTAADINSYLHHIQSLNSTQIPIPIPTNDDDNNNPALAAWITHMQREMQAQLRRHGVRRSEEGEGEGEEEEEDRSQFAGMYS